MEQSDYEFIINALDQKLDRLGNRIDKNIIYLIIIDFLGILNLIQPQWVKDLLPKLMPTDSKFANLIIPFALFYVFFMVGYTSIWYFKKRKQLNDFLIDYGSTQEEDIDYSKLTRIFTVFRPVSLGEVFYTYYNGISKNHELKKKEIALPFTKWIYMIFTSFINMLLAASNALVLFYCDHYLIGTQKLLALSFFLLAIFICYYDYNRMVREYTGSTKNMLRITSFNITILLGSFFILRHIF